jgi:uncharacterized membrane protein YcaP (DUF421 family)
MEESLKNIGYSLDMVKQSLRGKDIFNLEEVEWAVLEVNGSLSVLKKAEFQNIIRKDLNIVPSANRVPIELVMDGKILTQNLSDSSFTEEWLLTELRKRNIEVSEIAYAVVGTRGNLYVDLFIDH